MGVAIVGGSLLIGIAAFYVLLVLGFPFGEFAMGGANRVMPKKIRIACGISVPIQLFAAMCMFQLGGVLSTGITDTVMKYFGYGFGLYFGLNTVMNLSSKSKKERLVMTPLALIVSVCFLYLAFQLSK